MKHFKKKILRHYKKIPKTLLKKSGVSLLIIFFALTIIIQKDQTQPDMQFVWNMSEEFVHNAPNTQRDYLFEDEWGEEIYQWTLSTGGTSTTNTNTNEWLINPDDIENLLNELEGNTGTNATGGIYTGSIGSGTITTTGSQTNNKTGSIDCTTPRGETVKNKDFVLAYQQRKDVNTICNIEKRICMSGELLWSFAQSSCREDVVYIYQKAEVISYNQKILNEYIQPDAPIYSWGDFNNEGKIDTEEIPTANRWTSNNPVVEIPEIDQTPQVQKASCTTPRGTTIKHGQFAKAYKAPRGFVDMECEVEIRPCINGSLKWSFRYTKCTFNNTTYADYLTAGSPTSNTGFLFFERIKNLFN